VVSNGTGKQWNSESWWVLVVHSSHWSQWMWYAHFGSCTTIIMAAWEMQTLQWLSLWTLLLGNHHLIWKSTTLVKLMFLVMFLPILRLFCIKKLCYLQHLGRKLYRLRALGLELVSRIHFVHLFLSHSHSQSQPMSGGYQRHGQTPGGYQGGS
jgi:hypothetical protein